jgi:hypothetical protein
MLDSGAIQPHQYDEMMDLFERAMKKFDRKEDATEELGALISLHEQHVTGNMLQGKLNSARTLGVQEITDFTIG